MSSNPPPKLPETGESSPAGEGDKADESKQVVESILADENNQAEESSLPNDTDLEIDSFFATSPAGKLEFNPFASNVIDEEILGLPTGSTVNSYTRAHVSLSEG